MKKFLQMLQSLSIMLLLISAIAPLYAQQNPTAKFRVKLTPTAAYTVESNAKNKHSAARTSTGLADFEQLKSQYKVSKMKRVFRPAGKYEARHKQFGLDRWYEIETDDAQPTEQMVSDFGRLNSVSAVEREGEYHLFGNADEEGPRRMTNAPNDPLYYNQWHYDNQGQSGGTPNADINLPEAWAIETGNPDIVVGVIDGGIDVDHEDLINNMWINEDEIPDNSIDDDNNGYIDDVHGYNFVFDVPTIVAHSHGTHVAGTIAATNNNGVGLAGVAGGSGNGDGVRVMSLQVFSTAPEGGQEFQGGFAEAFIYAADNGATITNNSWGGPTNSEMINDAIRYYTTYAGVDPDTGISDGPIAGGGLAIFAAGNFNSYDQAVGVPAVSYPSVLEEVVCVANTNHHDRKDVSSFFSSYVDISAPGTTIYSTLPDNTYGGPNWTGTSMASPHVAGVAALVASKNAYNITAEEIKQRLLLTAKNIDDLNPSYVGYLGAGRVDAYAALADDPGFTPAITNWGFYGIDENTFHIGWVLVENEQGIRINDYEIMIAEGDVTDTTTFINTAQAYQHTATTTSGIDEYVITDLQSGTTYTVGIRAIDVEGNVSQISELYVATTWSAPSMDLVSADTLNLDIDIAADRYGYTSFDFRNTGEGISRFNWLATNYKNVTPAPEGISLSRSPSRDEDVPSFTYIDSAHHESLIVPDELIGPKSISFTYDYAYEGWKYANKYVAERDMNLTHVGAFISNEAQLAPQFSFAIYVGGEDYPSGEPRASTSRYIRDQREGAWYHTTLSTDVEVKAGEIYWVVVTAPDGVYFPIGAEKVTSGYAARDKSYVQVDPSTNYMTDIGSVFRYVLMIRAYEAVKNSDLASFSPIAGDIAPGEQRTVDVQVDGNAMSNGVHTFDLVTTHDDPTKGLLIKPVKVNVTGHTSEITASVEDIDFGVQYFNKEDEITFELRNEGQARVTNVSLAGYDSDHFNVEPTSIDFLEPGDVTTIIVSSLPQTVQNTVGNVLSITDSSSFTLNLPLSADYTTGPVLETTVSELTWTGADALMSGTVIADTSFRVKNTGNFPAAYTVENSTYSSESSPHIAVNITPTEGVLQPGDSIDVQFTIDLSSQNATTYSPKTNNIDVEYNGTTIRVPVRVEILGEPVIEMDATPVDFGELIASSGSITKTVEVTNTGTDRAYYTLTKPSAPFTSTDNVYSSSYINGGSSKSFTLVFEPAAVSSFNDTFAFNLLEEQSGAVAESFSVDLNGVGTQSPEIAVSWSSDISADTLAYGSGTGKSSTVTVTNNSGAASLSYAVSSPTWINVNGKAAEADGFDNGYGFAYNNANYNWQEIKESGEPLKEDFGFSTQISVDFSTFEFPYFGEKYKSATIGRTGFIVFGNDIGKFFGNFITELPDNRSGSSYANNVIAPFWASNTNFLNDESDIYVKETADSVIIQWENVGAYYRGYGGEFTFQLILKADGSMKYQYKSVEVTDVGAPRFVIGMEGPSGDFGMTINESMTSDHATWSGRAIELLPPLSGELAPGQTVDIDFQYNATAMAVGDYSADITLNSNDINNATFSTSVGLSVTGETDLSMEESTLSFNDLMYVNDSSSAQTAKLSIVNTGSKTGTISTVSFTGDEEFFITDLASGTAINPFDTTEFFVTYKALDAAAHTAELQIEADNGSIFTIIMDGDAVLPPSVAHDLGDGLEWIVNENESTTFNFNLSNDGAEELLNYAVTMGMSNQGWGLMSIEDVPEVFVDSIGYDLPEIESDGWYGGPDLETEIATKFTVKQDEGFYLTHVKTMLFRGESTDPIVVEILQGADIANAEVIHTQQFMGDTNLDSEMQSIPLDEQFFFEEGSAFFVKLIYPTSMEYKFSYNFGVPSSDGKYFISYDGGSYWEQAPFTYAWKLRAMSSMPNQWLSLDPSNGQINSQASQMVNVGIDATYLEVGLHQAFLYLAHDDPYQEVVKVPVTIRVNQAPVLGGANTYSVSEGETLEIELPVFDPEGDEVVSAEMTEVYEGLNASFVSGQLSLAYSPDYDMAGDYTFTITVVDEHGAEKSYDLLVEVLNTNRAPEVVMPLSNVALELDQSFTFNFVDMFIDPDNDALTYEIAALDDGVVEIYTASTDAIITLMQTGTATIDLTATDIYGASVTTTFTVGSNTAPTLAMPGKQTVSEGEELSLQIVVADSEGDEVTVTSIGDYEALTSTLDGGNLNITFAPDYSMAGVYIFSFAATDEHGAEEIYQLEVEVLNTNRLPEVVGEVSDLDLTVGESFSIDMVELFVDPDNDEITYSLEAQTEGVIEIHTSGSGSVMTAVQIGETVVTLTATDEYGASVSREFLVEVTQLVTAVDEMVLEDLMEVFPNPTRDFVNIRFGNSEEEDMVVSIYNNAGSIVFMDESPNISSDVYRIDISNLQSGVYLIKVSSRRHSSVRRILKK